MPVKSRTTCVITATERFLLTEGAGNLTVGELEGSVVDLTNFLNAGTPGLWGADGAGNGLISNDFIAGGNTPQFLVDGTALSWNGAVQAAIEAVIDIAVPASNTTYPIMITGPAGPGTQGLAINIRSDGTIRLRVAHNGVTGTYYVFNDVVSGAGRVVVHGLYDSTELVAADRARFYVNGVRQAPTGGALAVGLNDTLDYFGAGSLIAFAERLPGFIGEGALWVNSVPSDALITSIVANLQVNHDVDPECP